MISPIKKLATRTSVGIDNTTFVEKIKSSCWNLKNMNRSKRWTFSWHPSRLHVNNIKQNTHCDKSGDHFHVGSYGLQQVASNSSRWARIELKTLKTRCVTKKIGTVAGVSSSCYLAHWQDVETDGPWTMTQLLGNCCSHQRRGDAKTVNNETRCKLEAKKVKLIRRKQRVFQRFALTRPRRGNCERWRNVKYCDYSTFLGCNMLLGCCWVFWKLHE